MLLQRQPLGCCLFTKTLDNSVVKFTNCQIHVSVVSEHHQVAAPARSTPQSVFGQSIVEAIYGPDVDAVFGLELVGAGVDEDAAD